MNRRVGFFAIAALVCFLLMPVVEEKVRWVPAAIGALYAVLTLLALLDLVGRRKL